MTYWNWRSTGTLCFTKTSATLHCRILRSEKQIHIRNSSLEVKMETYLCGRHRRHQCWRFLEFSPTYRCSHIWKQHTETNKYIFMFVFIWTFAWLKRHQIFQTSSRNSYTIPTLWMTFSHSRCHVGCFGFVDWGCGPKKKTLAVSRWMTNEWFSHIWSQYINRHPACTLITVIKVLAETQSDLVCCLQTENESVTLL